MVSPLIQSNLGWYILLWPGLSRGFKLSILRNMEFSSTYCPPHKCMFSFESKCSHFPLGSNYSLCLKPLWRFGVFLEGSSKAKDLLKVSMKKHFCSLESGPLFFCSCQPSKSYVGDDFNHLSCIYHLFCHCNSKQGLILSWDS